MRRGRRDWGQSNQNVLEYTCMKLSKNKGRKIKMYRTLYTKIIIFIYRK